MRGGNVIAVSLATVCGIATAYTTFQPALEEQKERRESPLAASHKDQDIREQEKKISQAITSDLNEAKDELKRTGFAWGIRQALFGTESSRTSAAAKKGKSPGE
ncbi:unnamed protein product [Zymoseptoria tritici ST99CH_1A5]|uniref:Uncharacterized protein n=3 Tax=Zymoseptoria tritici TaxID=1047171 RepID=A0A1X7RFL6_ZYMT9|nr:unnamed protein product [Zymoseptoria tritici ST99CH_3D7]SMR42560.1 unnamed protein product [Zymoseptoria tritici ST99CH_1E4]SMR44734.1 unnamed protein product [Zymoseptoria tritici ST99CH_3D1]SMY19899.1 unnamed protein product [Zymoseptoria tritici ST99CH_1A5]